MKKETARKARKVLVDIRRKHLAILLDRMADHLGDCVYSLRCGWVYRLLHKEGTVAALPEDLQARWTRWPIPDYAELTDAEQRDLREEAMFLVEVLRREIPAEPPATEKEVVVLREHVARCILVLRCRWVRRLLDEVQTFPDDDARARWDALWDRGLIADRAELTDSEREDLRTDASRLLIDLRTAFTPAPLP